MGNPEALQPKIKQPLKQGGEGTFGRGTTSPEPSLTQQNKRMQMNNLPKFPANEIAASVNRQELPISGNRRSDTNQPRPQEQTPDWLNNPLLTQKDKKELLAHDAYMRQKMEEDRIMRDNEPTAPGRFEMDGKMVTLVEAFSIYREKAKQREAEARAKGELEQYHLSVVRSLSDDKPYAALNTEEKKERNYLTVRVLDYHLAKEAQETQFDQIAEDIQQKMWKDNPHTPLVTVTPTHYTEVSISKINGTIRNRSRSGITLSYSGEGIKTTPNRLSFGIGYFTDRSHISPEARTSVSDEDLKRGVKAYFVQRVYTEMKNGEAETKTDILAVPLAYSESARTYVEYLYNAAESLAPEKTIHKSSRRTQQAA